MTKVATDIEAVKVLELVRKLERDREALRLVVETAERFAAQNKIRRR